MNSNWAKWIKQSLCKHFNDNKGTLTFNFEGDDDAVTVMRNHFELRIDGPDVNTAPGAEKFTFAVNCLVSTAKDMRNVFKHEENVGIVLACFATGMSIYNDSNTVIDCLRREDDITVVDYGYIKEGVGLKQSTIEAQYSAYLKG